MEFVLAMAMPARAIDFIRHPSRDFRIPPGAIVHAPKIVNYNLGAAFCELQGIRSSQAIAGPVTIATCPSNRILISLTLRSRDASSAKARPCRPFSAIRP